MFYKVGEGRGHLDAGLSHNPFNSLIVPRPIAWVSTISRDGATNLAPFSYFNGVSNDPPLVMFTPNQAHEDGGEKDTLRNIRETEEFVLNFVPASLLQKMNQTSIAAPRGVDEFDLAGLTKTPSRVVAPPRVAESPVHIECRLVQIVTLPAPSVPDHKNTMVIGIAVGIHIDDDLIVDGRVDILKTEPVGRLGYFDFTIVRERQEVARPKRPGPLR